MSTWLWWSSGKDSAWALHTLRARGETVTALVTTVTRNFARVAMHAVRVELLQQQAAAAGLPLHIVEIPYPCPNNVYEAAARKVVRRARGEGVTQMAFGDLFLADVRAYRERLLAGSGVAPVFPLWGRETSALANEMLAGGLRARLTCADPRALPKRFAGREWNAELLMEFAALENPPDPCGENGEFHTFAWAGPMFAAPIPVQAGAVEERDGFVFADLIPA